jgi:CBS domain-containing protein
MSPRAAWRLESLGFTGVYDYMPGKADWFASGLPREGRLAAVPRIGHAARPDVPLCNLTDQVGDVRDRVQKTGWNICVVVNDERIVLGLLRARELGADPEAAAEQVMRSGPATFRPDVPVADVLERMRKRNVRSVVVTTSDGRLVGLLRQEDAEQVATEADGAR